MAETEGGTLLAAQFIKLTIDPSEYEAGRKKEEVESEKFAQRIENRFKKIPKNIAPDLNKTNPFETYFSRADAALVRFDKLGTQGALRRALVAQSQLRAEIEKGGPAAGKYAARYADLTSHITGAQKRFSQINDDISDQNYLLREGQVQWLGWGDTANVAIGKFGGLQMQIQAFVAAFTAGLFVGKKIGDFIGVDYGEVTAIFTTWKTELRSTNEAAVDFGASLINLGKDLAFDSSGADNMLRHMREDLNGLIGLGDKAAYGYKAARGLAIARSLDIDVRGATSLGTNPIQTRDQARKIAEAQELAARAGVEGMRKWHEAVERTSKTFDQLYANAVRITPKLREMADTVAHMERIQQWMAIYAQQSSLAVQDYNFDAAREALQNQAQELQRIAVPTNTKNSEADKQKLAMAFEQNRLAGVGIDLAQKGLAIDALQARFEDAKARGALRTAEALQRQLNAKREDQARTANLPKENIDATKLAGDAALRALSDEERARRTAALQVEIENARLFKQWDLVKSLTRENNRLAIASANAHGQGQLAAALQIRGDMQIRALDMERAGAELAQKQISLEIARVEGDAVAYRRLRDAINAANVERTRMENGYISDGRDTDAGAATLLGLPGWREATAAAAKIRADVTAEERGYSLDTQRTLLALNREVTDIYRQRGVDVLAQLKDQERRETELQIESLQKQFDFQMKMATDPAGANAIIEGMRRNLYQKLEQLDFEYATGWQASLNRQVAAFGSMSQRIESLWSGGVQNLTTLAQDGFFDLFTGNIHHIDDVFKDFLTSMEREIINFIMKEAVKRFLLFVGSYAMGFSSGLWGAAGRNDFGTMMGSSPGVTSTPVTTGSTALYSSSAASTFTTEPTAMSSIRPAPNVGPSGGKSQSDKLMIELKPEPGWVAAVVAMAADQGYSRVSEDIRLGGPLRREIMLGSRRA